MFGIIFWSFSARLFLLLIQNMEIAFQISAISTLTMIVEYMTIDENVFIIIWTLCS